MAAPTLRNAMSVDVEDYFQVQAYADVIPRRSWDAIPMRVEVNMNRILDMFDAAGVKATFFTLGWVAERQPGLVRRIVADGHELASHGYGHQRVDQLGAADFLDDVSRARTLLEDIGGVAVTGYRAPTFSIGSRTPWAYTVLERAGYRYSSSVFPIAHDLYGDPLASRLPFRPRASTVLELPMTTVRMLGRNLPCAGGGYFRLLPYDVYLAGLRRLNRLGRRGIFYFHPWEIDPEQPVVPKCGAMAGFRHRVNLSAMAGRLKRLLQDVRWGRVDEVFASDLAAPAKAAA